MTTSFASSAQVWNPEMGEFISESHRHLAEVLNDYNPNLNLVYIPIKDRLPGDTKPFAILEHKPGWEPQIIRYLSEQDMKNPSAILAWVFEGDMTKNGGVNGLLRRIELQENAERLMVMKARQEELEDIIEYGAFLSTGGRNKLHTIHQNGKKIER
jgi:hypothetical protein